MCRENVHTHWHGNKLSRGGHVARARTCRLQDLSSLPDLHFLQMHLPLAVYAVLVAQSFWRGLTCKPFLFTRCSRPILFSDLVISAIWYRYHYHTILGYSMQCHFNCITGYFEYNTLYFTLAIVAQWHSAFISGGHRPVGHVLRASGIITHNPAPLVRVAVIEPLLRAGSIAQPGLAGRDYGVITLVTCNCSTT